MDVSQLVVGNKYWTIRQSSYNAADEFKPERPWQGTLAISKRANGDCYVLQIYMENIVVEPHHLFEEKYLAADAYVRDTMYWIAEQHKKLARENEKLAAYMGGEPYFIVDREHLKR